MKDNKEIVVILIGLFVVFGFAFEPLKEATERNDSGNNMATTTKNNLENIKEQLNMIEAELIKLEQKLNAETKNK